jgi:hypothetical protein
MPKGKNIMCRFAKCFEVTKGFSCFKMLGTMTLHVSSQAHLFPEPEHTFKRASDMMPRQSSQTVHRGMTLECSSLWLQLGTFITTSSTHVQITTN